MKAKCLVILAVCAFSGSLVFSQESSVTSPKLKAEVEKMKQWEREPQFLTDTKAQNAKKVPLDKIKEMDQEWIDSKEVTTFQRSLMTNACAKRLEELVKQLVTVEEAFVMDDQGALVCLTKKTSDYWQGDEEKWSESFYQGKGRVYIGKQEYDMSTKTTLVHLSVPLMDGDKAIGAICAGISLTKLAETP
jgi:hypothetical protein